METYIKPALDYIEAKLTESIKNSNGSEVSTGLATNTDTYLAEIQDSLYKFQQDHNDHKTAFIMMQFGTNPSSQQNRAVDKRSAFAKRYCWTESR